MKKMLTLLLISAVIIIALMAFLSKKRMEYKFYEEKCRNITLEILKSGKQCECVPGILNKTKGCICYCKAGNRTIKIFIGLVGK